MARRLPFSRVVVAWLAVPAFLLAFGLTSICMTPTVAHAKRMQTVAPPSDGGGANTLPGQGDDDQPTAPSPSRRSMSALSAPDDGSGASSGTGSDGQPFFDSVRRVLMRGRVILRKLVSTAP